MKNSTSGNGVGGGERGRGGIGRPISTYQPMSVIQNITDNLESRRLDFLELAKLAIAKAARAALDKNTNLTPKQKEQLRDAERGKYAHGNRLVALLLEGMAEATDPMAFANAVGDSSLRGVAAAVAPALCVKDTFLTNTRDQHKNDIRQVEFLLERTPAKRDAVLDTMGPEETSFQFHKMALLAWNPTGRRTFA